MPEGPELFRDALKIRQTAERFKRFGFTSQSGIEKWGKFPQLSDFEVDARSRGKELVLFLSRGGRTLHRFRFHNGMSGWWSTYSADDVYVHAHVRLHGAGAGEVLAWNDVRRFGGWKALADGEPLWSADRGPDPYQEFDAFAARLEEAVGDGHRLLGKPVGAALLDQSLFNGVGNYLRAEILGRDEPHIHPNTPLKAVIEGSGTLGFARRVHGVFKSVIENVVLGTQRFDDWLRVYGIGTAFKDSSGRRMWVPSAKSKSSKKESSAKKKRTKKEEEEEEEEEEEPPLMSVKKRKKKKNEK